MDINAYKCYECSQQFEGLDQAIEHLKSHGIKNSQESRIMCIKVQSSCNLVCTSALQIFQALKRHIKGNRCQLRFSGADSDNDSNNEHEDLVKNLSEFSFEENFSSSNDKNNEHKKSECSDNFASYMGTFVDKLTSFKLHHAVLDEIFVHTKQLLLQSTEVNKQLIRDNPQLEVEFILDSTNDFANSHIDSVVTRYKRKIHVAKSRYFVESKPVYIGGSYVNGVIYFVSVLENLRCMFANKDFRREYFNYNENHRCKEGVYERYCCGQHFQENSFFQNKQKRNPNTIIFR